MFLVSITLSVSGPLLRANTSAKNISKVLTTWNTLQQLYPSSIAYIHLKDIFNVTKATY